MKLMHGTDISWQYITNLSDIPPLINLVKSKPRLALDTETYALYDLYKDKASALDPHTSRIRLIQLNWDNNYLPIIIDVFKIGIEPLQPFIEELAKPDILKLFHNAAFDLKQFRSTFGIWLNNTHCTKVLMQTLGISTGFKASQLRKHSLVALARDYFDEHLDKTEGASDWSINNLSLEQLEYAALDVAASKDSGINSIVLQGYDLLKEAVCNDFDEEEAFIIDQQAMYVAARAEYAGMYINLDLLSKVSLKAKTEMESSRLKLCAALGFPLTQELQFNPDTNSFEHSTIVPDKIAVLLNNNKKLVLYINEVLKNTVGRSLNSLQAGELESTLKTIEVEKDELEELNKLEENEEENEDFSDYGIELIRDLLNYKKFNKLLSECNKYRGIINPVTKRVHTNFNPIGAATGRMSSAGDLNLQQVSTLSMILELEGELIKQW